MEQIKKWRFVGNNYATENGLDTGDVEIFKKDPIASLARETCQNSVDAKGKGKKKVILEFKTFDITSSEVPGYERLKSEIKNCKEYKKAQKNKDYEPLLEMEKEISKEKIQCLRISDYNTTGLYGEKFYWLTKGSGITDKTGAAGGSKGLGKFAAFEASTFNTVFYSTYTEDGERKHLGIAKLCSAPLEGSEDEKTIGIGYFGQNEKNEPMEEELELEPGYKRETYGTDVYILGFKREHNWKIQILSKLLESFLVTIFKDELEIRVDDIVVNKENLKEIIENEELIIKAQRKSIKAQYTLMSEGEGVYTKEVEIEEYGKIKIYVKSYSREEAEFATNNCLMVRYPYMKIKEIPGISTMPCSAMCIIEGNELNVQLREIENAQHTDWEYKRKKDEVLRAELKHILQQLKSEIIDFVIEVLSTSETEKLDIEGAGDYLPETEMEDTDMGTGEKEETVVKDVPIIVKKAKNKRHSKNPIIPTDTPEGLEPDIGGHEDEEGDSPTTRGHNDGKKGTPHEGDETRKSTEEGDSEILKTVELTDMKKLFFVSNKSKGEYVAIIDSVYDEEDCELEVKYFDDAGNTYNAQITKCTIEGKEQEIKEGKTVKFKIKKEKIKVEVETNLKDYYRCEVKVYANRK